MLFQRRGKPTVTDATLILGYIDPSNFLSGQMKLDPDLSKSGIEEQIARPLEVSLIEAAAGIMKITTANSMSAMRQITVEEGKVPAEYILLAFGGAGLLFATILVKELNVPEVIVPLAPAAFSAWGMLMCDISYEVSQTFISTLEGTPIETLNRLFQGLEEKIQRILAGQNAKYQKVVIQKKLELRYLGQEHTLETEFKENQKSSEDSGVIRKRFDDLHYIRFGHKMKDPVEIVNLRVRGIGVLDKPEPPKIRKRVQTGKMQQQIATRKAFCLLKEQMTDFSIIRREDLFDGDALDGPAIVDEGVARTVIHSGQRLRVDEFGNLIIRT